MDRLISRKKVRACIGLLVFQLLLWCQLTAQQSKFVLKSGVGGIFFGHAVGEGELALNDETSLTLRIGLVHPNLDVDRKPWEGVFFKAGPKFYLGQKGDNRFCGWALRPELQFGHLRDWETNVRGNFGARWVISAGAMVSVSRGFPIGSRVILEPHFGLGYVAVFDSYLFVNDSPPNETSRTGWSWVEKGDREFFEHSQLSLMGGLCGTGGLLVGVSF